MAIGAAVKVYDKGDRVTTPGGSGTVVYRRVLGPDFQQVGHYSVALDHKVAEQDRPPFPSYTGTIYPASEVTDSK